MVVISILILGIWSVEFLVFRFVVSKSLFAAQLARLLAGFIIFNFCYYFGFIHSDFLNFGDLSAMASPVYWLGIGETETWKTVSVGFLFSISLVTFLSLYIPNKKLLKRPKWSFQWFFIILFLALINAAIEEILYRLIPLSVGNLSPATLALCSGIAFGLPHYFGHPSKWLGIILAGFLGWFLAKSVLETQGIFLAFLFHWVQDILIIGILSMSKKTSIYRDITEDKKVFIKGILPTTITLIVLSAFTYFAI
ncbi:CPBP family intramembrane glutamic endopeptidase [Pseudobdellovibrio exovorus]|uniref:CAAX prenyl protease 2/Lysostaphin resistance protein A-like domain-containing protein n=1 Tax=Pseudobdellovibrio exovorus JSS TaxID=1184267 RepID=M4VF03_9BACT|nr:CPBP family intramembrane glutamic endopeptidase [Pseudobdellovibrio exovorus]AGH96621.1 hypothetical protein A11Q_2405 [Pseudobdellovibrio exovorus JSS]